MLGRTKIYKLKSMERESMQKVASKDGTEIAFDFTLKGNLVQFTAFNSISVFGCILGSRSYNGTFA